MTAQPNASHETSWQPDILGDSWQQRELRLTPDLPGDPSPVATLIRHVTERSSGAPPSPNPAPERAVLYLHGYNDYFFQRHVGEHFASHGYDFYALDLRRCGRSWRVGQSPHYVTEMSSYFEEITAAMRILREESGYSEVILHGHSTGGLTSVLWCADIRTKDEFAQLLPDAMVLNSPWIALQGDLWWRIGARIAAYSLAPFAPQASLGGLSEHYGQAMHQSGTGEWDYDLEMKPHSGLPARAAWLRAVMRGHHRVHRGLDLPMPILVCTSAQSGNRYKAHDALLTTDSVLTAKNIRKAAPRLGPHVTQHQFAGAHDLALSPRPVRDDYLNYVTQWLDITV